MPHVVRPLALVCATALALVIGVTGQAEEGAPRTADEAASPKAEDEAGRAAVEDAAGALDEGSLAMSSEPSWSDDFEDDWDDWDEELETVPSGYSDPFEPVNRVTLTFNNAMDRVVLDQITRFYRFMLPEFSRSGLVRILTNVNSPQVMVNDALQLEWKDAGVVTARLVVNSIAGVGGIYDVGRKAGLEPHESDFGQTLTLAGVPPGTYLMLPLFGPANMRDTIGIGVDALLHPTFYLLPGTDLLLFGGSAGVVTRARYFEELQALKESSVDVYSAMRSGYYQTREAEIWSRREDRRPSDEQEDDASSYGDAGAFEDDGVGSDGGDPAPSSAAAPVSAGP
jgi:phospholipid-binding lipoprotein MlaA